MGVGCTAGCRKRVAHGIARLLGFPNARNGDSERVEERSCGFRVEKARS
jgi:hypothetical protein